MLRALLIDASKHGLTCCQGERNSPCHVTLLITRIVDSSNHILPICRMILRSFVPHRSQYCLDLSRRPVL